MPRLRLVIAGFVIAAMALPLAKAVMVKGGEPSGTVEQHGVVLPTWKIHGYEGAATTKATNDIAGVGATWIQFTPTWKMATGTSSTIDSAWTVTDAGLVSAIDFAHSKGLKIMLKPHVDPQDGTNRWAINPSDRAAWFNSYQAMITHYATIAAAERRRGVLGGLRTDHHVGFRRPRRVADDHRRNQSPYTALRSSMRRPWTNTPTCRFGISSISSASTPTSR